VYVFVVVTTFYTMVCILSFFFDVLHFR